MAAVRAARRVRRRSVPVGRILLLGFFLVFVLLPLYWMFNTSIKPSDDYLAIPPVWFPDAPTLVHYEAALFAYRGLDGLINSLIVSLAATALSALLGTLMAYSLARYNTGGQHLSFWVLSQRFLPPIGIVLPVFLIYRGVGLYDTHVGLIIAYTVFTLPVSVWMMFAYFRGMPKSMEEAALVDGCTRWEAFWRVAVPLAAPGIVAAAVFAFIACWTEFFFALILTSRTAFTLPTVFRAFIGFQGAQYGEAAALAIVSLVPSIALGVLAQTTSRARADARRGARIGTQQWRKSGSPACTSDMAPFPPCVASTSTFRDGEFTVLVGPSGCGKSTLLRTIAGLEEASEGTIEIGGEVVNDFRPRDRDVAMVFQDYALYPHMSVAKNIGFGLKARKMPQAGNGGARCRWRRACSASPSCSTATRASFPAASASASRSAAPSCATRASFSSTSRSPIWTRSCATRCAARSSGSTSRSPRR